MPQSRPISPLTLLAAACVAFLCSCATPEAEIRPDIKVLAETPAEPASAAATPASGASAVAARASATRPAAAPSGPPLPPFATVTQGSRRVDGMLTLWQKDDKVWLELKPEDFNKPMFFSPKVSQGLGEGGLFGGSMLSAYGAWGAPRIVEFRKIHNLVQLVALNETFRARAGTPQAHAVDADYSTSLIGSTPVASQPDGASHGVLIEANNLFLVDTLGMAIHLQQMFRQGYGFDQRNSYFDSVRGSADEVMFDVTAHYFTQSIANSFPNAPAGAPQPTIPSFIPDARSLFLGLHYSLARLPEKPMATRPADPRVGFFTTTVADFTDDQVRSPRERFINHWRLEKKDPAAEMSEPVRPITYWLDRSIPLKYRDAITRGILEWNKAFEKIGFRNAIVVKVQPEDAAFDTLDVGATSVRWAVNAEPIYDAIGPTHVDPRSGEILDAGISIESVASRNLRADRVQVLERASASGLASLLQAPASELAPAAEASAAPKPFGLDAQACLAGDFESEQADYGLDVLEARGDIDPDSPQADAFVQAYLTNVTMHEVGHTLGLRHNFRASRMNTDKDLSDPGFTQTHPLSGSVMDYPPINLPRPGEPVVKPFDNTLGPYDYWAIEYAYKPMPAGTTPAQEKAELLKIAARNTEPGLDYGTDEDNYLGVDPAALQGDLGADPVAYAQKRFAIARDLFTRQESRTLRPDEDYAVLRRSVRYALRDAVRASGVLLRQLGGVATLRDFPGSGRDPMQPVPAAQQRAALDTLVDGVLAPDSFRISPALQRRLAPDFLERGDVSAGGDPVSTDYPVESVMLDFQRQLLFALMSDGLAQRLEDSAPKLDRPAQALAPSEVYARITRALWSDADNFGAGGKGDIPARRRELQRDHVNRLAVVLLRTPGGVRVDLRSTLRAEAASLLPRIQAAQRRPGLSEASRLHLADCAETLRAALNAPMERAGF
ncbi:zinc-dependent metalloprotease [Scleromatobacter humisilvae]|uniref:Zinc-dependent metalloprotease n=1 Tax=Scleromatobacter humisilvae TaxID=2897159 RepID=A0A9X1YG31_9BURK|nr:zinc-dependent metalloprotease [Scleromatobacter humisilvae]MCK9684190.1 zinc-dependent metalloprotease [Scleromatobacter humisilvae]